MFAVAAQGHHFMFGLSIRTLLMGLFGLMVVVVLGLGSARSRCARSRQSMVM